MKFSFSTQKKIRHVLWGTLVLSALVAVWPSLEIGRQLERATLDYRYAHFNRSKASSDQVVLIDIDEQSLKLLAPAYGRWPLPRRIYREMIEFLSVGEPAGILFDLQFVEPQLNTDDDAQLASISAQVKGVSHAMNLLTESQEHKDGIAGPEPLPSDFAGRFGIKWTHDPGPLAGPATPFQDFALPAPTFYKVIPRIHSVAFGRDSDGVSRRVRWLFHYGDAWIPSLSLSGLLARFEQPRLEQIPGGLRIVETGMTASETGMSASQSGSSPKTLDLPMDADGTFALHFYQTEKRPETIPLAAVLDSAAKLQKGEVADPADLKVNPLQLKGKVLLVGCSATGCEDLKATPVDPAYPGALLHATAMSNVLTGDVLRKAPRAVGFAVGLMMLIVTFLCVMFLDSIFLKVGLPLVLFLVYFTFSAFCFHSLNLWLEIAMPASVGMAALLDGLAYVGFVEAAEKKRVKSTLSKYLSPVVTEQMVANGTDPTAEVGHATELSVMFSDIRGFTTLSEKLEPKVLVGRLNDYLGKMTEVIFRHEGTLDKFIGDAVMAFWGAPLHDEHHAKHAVECAIGMNLALIELKEDWVKQGKTEMEISVGIGINTGRVIVGNIGSEKRLDYTVIGDNVNLASRVEGLTKQYRVGLLIAEGTRSQVEKDFVCRIIDCVQVKGKTKGVAIYEPLCTTADARAPLLKELATQFEKAFAAYQKAEFTKAVELFTATDLWARQNLGPAKANGDGPCQMYLGRCQELIEDAPTEWNGIYVAKSK